MLMSRGRNQHAILRCQSEGLVQPGAPLRTGAEAHCIRSSDEQRSTQTMRREVSVLKIIILSALTAGLAAGITHAGPQGNTVVPLVRAAGAAGLCFHRAYGLDHLRRNPGQTIAAMTVLLTPLGEAGASGSSVSLTTKIKLRDGTDRLGMATCWWEEGANVQGRRRLLPSLRGDDGTR